MPVFIGVHKMEPFSEEKMQELWGKYKDQVQGLGLRAIRLHYNGEKGTAYCETEANSADEVMAAHQGLKIPQEIIEIKTLT